MAESHVVSALIKKRAELAGKIEHLQGEIKKAALDLDNVEATLKLFDPEINIAAISPRKVPHAHIAYRGEASRILLEALRESVGPLSTIELNEKVMEAMGLDRNDKGICNLMMKRTAANLRHWQNKRGTIRAIAGAGQVNLWELVR